MIKLPLRPGVRPPRPQLNCGTRAVEDYGAKRGTGSWSTVIVAVDLRREGAKAFATSWSDLLDRIASKSVSLTRTKRA